MFFLLLYMRLPMLLAFAIFANAVFAQPAVFNKALERAEKENKLVMVDFYTDWCYWCKVLDKKTFTDPVIKERIKERFILIRLNAEKADGVDLAKRYGIHSYPICVFINPQKQVVAMQPGYAEPAVYLKFLDTIWKQKLAGQTLGYSPAFSLTFPDFYEKMHHIVRNKIVWPKPAEFEQYMENEKNWDTEVGFIVINKLYSKNYKKHLNRAATYKKIWEKQYGRVYSGQTFSYLLTTFIDSNLNIPTQAMYDTLMSYCMMAENNDSVKAQKSCFGYMSSYLFKTGQWNAYAKWIDGDYRENRHEYANAGLNEAAWSIYENSRDTEALNIALEWMKTVVATDDDYNHADTYAAILYALKRFDEAEIAAKEAILLAKKSGEKYEETEKLLGKIYAER